MKVLVAMDSFKGSLTSVEAGQAAACKLGELVATHVIPRPHGDVELILPKA